MSLRDRLFELIAVEEVDQFLEKYPTCAIFKAGSCHKTMQGFGHIENALDKRDNIHMAFVRVIESRPVSNYIAEITEITHQSPQFILLVNGEVVYDVDNWDINPEDVEAALLEHLGPVEEKQMPDKDIKHADVSYYVQLLDRYISDELSDDDFEREWLIAFQMDSALRSTKEFDLLNSLFGDVDAALSERQNVAFLGELTPPCSTHNPMKDKAKKLYYELKSQMN